MKKIGIFGGSFNPPHVGHIQSAVYAAEQLGLDRLLLMPTWQTPGKNMPDASPEQRLAMLRLAVRGQEKLTVSDLELRQEQECYTCDTVRTVQAQYPGAEIYLLLGTDMFLKFRQWRHAPELLRTVTLAALRRGDKKEASALEGEAKILTERGGKVLLLDNPVLPISSTQVRRLLAFQAGADFLNPGVYDFIRQEKLYDTGAGFMNLPMAQLEPVVVRLLNPNRVNHVLGCRDTAVALAKKWGADEVDAARAGILHDITKALDGPLQLTLCRAYGRILDDFSRKYPKTLHALTGSLVAERIFGENKAVVSAIESHTTGKANMNLLETIIYVADYMEPNRDFPGVEKLRALAFTDLRAALKLGLEMTLDHLKEQGGEVSPASREALAYLNANSI